MIRLSVLEKLGEAACAKPGGVSKRAAAGTPLHGPALPRTAPLVEAAAGTGRQHSTAAGGRARLATARITAGVVSGTWRASLGGLKGGLEPTEAVFGGVIWRMLRAARSLSWLLPWPAPAPVLFPSAPWPTSTTSH